MASLERHGERSGLVHGRHVGCRAVVAAEVVRGGEGGHSSNDADEGNEDGSELHFEGGEGIK